MNGSRVEMYCLLMLYHYNKTPILYIRAKSYQNSILPTEKYLCFKKSQVSRLKPGIQLCLTPNY